MKPKMQIYYDKEADYLEIRFGKPTESHFEKIGEDTFIRIDDETGEKRGYAIFNVKKVTSPLKTIEIEIPLSVIKELQI